MAKDQLLKEAEIKVDRADIEAAARSAAKMQFIQYGMLNVPEDILDNYVTEMLKDKNGNIIQNNGHDQDTFIDEKGIEYLINKLYELDESYPIKS